jgi:hypothetical protein
MTGRLLAGAWLIAGLFAGAIGMGAQVQSVDTSQPIVVKSSKPASPKHLRFLGEFLSSTPSAVTVRDPNNTYTIRTFSYAPDVRAKMLQIAGKGGFHHGDKIEIEYATGSDVALRIKGKPSSSAVH